MVNCEISKEGLGSTGNWKRFQKRNQKEEQANICETQRSGFGRNMGYEGKGREVKNPWFPQLFAEVGTFGASAFQK